MAAVVAVALLIGVAAADLGAAAVSAERAQATADLAALATVVHGGSAGAAVARANGAGEFDLERLGSVVLVRVERSGSHAAAAAAPG